MESLAAAKISESEPNLPQAGSMVRSANSLLTIRGFGVLIVSLLLIFGPAKEHSDIIASMLAYCLVAVLAILPPLTFLQSLYMRQQLRLKIFPPTTDGKSNAHAVFAQSPTNFLIRLAPLKILPFFILNIRLEYEAEGIVSAIHKVSGTSIKDRILSETISFPHRGIWKLRSIGMSFGDQLGLSSIRWRYLPTGADSAIEVRPSAGHDMNLPPFSSCHVAGDLAPDTQERLGDPYDLKRYNPADGLRKIVWKVFARTGELVARHPEQSVTPEGRILIYILAGPNDDHVCSTAMYYLNAMEQLKLESFVSCDGNLSGNPAKGPTASLSLMIDSIWHSVLFKENIAAFELFLESAKNASGDSVLTSLVLFISKNCTADILDRAEILGHKLSESGVVPIFIVVANPNSPRTLDGEITKISPIKLKLKNWFMDSAVSDHPNNTARISQFLDLCAKNNWGVYL